MKSSRRFAMTALSAIFACLLLLGTGSGTIVQAQEYQAGVYFTTLVPHGEFSQNVTNNGYGGGGSFLVRLGGLPVLVGGDFGGVVYGSESHRETVNTSAGSFRIRVRTSNNILLTHGIVRLQPREGRLRPYLDGLIGLKYLFTTTSISDTFDDEVIDSETRVGDTTLSYGIGGGMQVPLTGAGRLKVLLDGNVRYLRGGRAEYLKKGSIREVNGQTVFDVLSSRTDTVSVQVGVTFRF